MRSSLLLLPLLVISLVAADVPSLKDHFGFTPGDDYKLANYQQIYSYYQKLAAVSPRIKLFEFGQTSEGRPMFYAAISSPQNLQRLDMLKSINRRLALGEPDPTEAARLAKEGRTVIWIDSSMHATEVAPAQHSPHLAHLLTSGETDEIKRILDKVILIQIPVTNPDGLDAVSAWILKNVGTPYELAPFPGLYQKYAGHDNNRDWYMMNLPETRHLTKLLYEEWFPQVVYNQHQAPPFPARIFIPPYAEPANPNIPAAVSEGINIIGSAMKERLAQENKPGAISYWGFDGWWNGGLRSTPAFHNMHGILTEVALYGAASPFEYQLKHIPERFANGIPAKQSSIFYERPFLGGRWGTREAIEYVLTCDMALLDYASTRSEQLLFKAWRLATDNIQQGKAGGPFAYVIPANQWDRSAAHEMVTRLTRGGLKVTRSTKPIQIGDKTYPEGSYVIPAGQAFRAYLIDLMEQHVYPDIRLGSATGPRKRPYDIAGWTMPYLMGVKVDRINDTFLYEGESITPNTPYKPAIDHKENSSFLVVADMLARKDPVRLKADGSFTTMTDPPGYGFDDANWELRTPRVAIYQPNSANMDAGWTQWLLDYYKVPVTMIGNKEIRAGKLRERFDSIILASQSANSILYGTREGESRPNANGDGRVVQRPEYTGGIELDGLLELDRFVRAGGTLLCFDQSSDIPVNYFPLPVRTRIRTSAGESESQGQVPDSAYYSPGSILRGKVDNKHPLAFGMPEDITFFTTGGQAFDIALDAEANKGEREVRSIAKYASKDLLASGYLQGERVVAGKDLMLEARHGQGKVILYGFRPQFRGQSFGTFKLVLNALYLASAKTLR